MREKVKMDRVAWGKKAVRPFVLACLALFFASLTCFAGTSSFLGGKAAAAEEERGEEAADDYLSRLLCEYGSAQEDDFEIVWYMAEGCTAGGMETWLTMLNPEEEPSVLDIDFFTTEGRVQGPRGIEVPPLSRCTLNVNEYIKDCIKDCYDVSMAVMCEEGVVICERSMYGPGKA